MRPERACRSWVPRGLAAAAFLSASGGASAREIADLFAELSPAVVRVKIITEEPDENGKPSAVVHVSSGFFIDDQGRVLTSQGDPTALTHAVRKLVEWRGVSFAAELVGFDPRTSVALLQVLQLPDGFATIPVQAPDQPPPIGARVLSITTPIAVSKLIELPPTPVEGIVAGYEGSIANFEFPFSYVRSNLPRHGDEPGAAVLDLEGRLVGIVVSWIPEVRSCYLVPTAALARMVEDFADHGYVTYRTLPIKFAERENAEHTALEVVISDLAPDGAAARAGLRTSDVVRRIGTTAINRMRDVRDALFFSRSGEFTRVEVERDGRRQEWALPVEEAPPPNVVTAESETALNKKTPPPVAAPVPDFPSSNSSRILDEVERAMAPRNN